MNPAGTFIRLPPVVSANAMYRSIARGRVIKSKPYRAWIEEAGKVLQAQRPEPVPGRVEVGLEVPRAAGDIDNRAKPILDLLEAHGIIDNDRNVECLAIKWADGVDHVLVWVRPLREEVKQHE